MKCKRQSIKSDIFVGGICVVFLLINLSAVGSGGRRRAKEAVCLSNLRQWGTAFQLYAEDNDGILPFGWIHDGIGVCDPGYYWMEALRLYYGNVGNLRLCPAASKIGSEIGLGEYNNSGRTDVAWGRFSGNWCWVVPGDYGSYGWNSFICGTPDEINGQPTGGAWGMPPSLYNWKTPNVEGAASVPLLGDSKWIDGWPHHNDEPPAYDGDPITNQMSRICMNRHDGFVNWVFLDSSARNVGIKELWTLKWSRQFNTCGPWTVCGGVQPEEWPVWMREFEDY
jgi:hypothetical protein